MIPAQPILATLLATVAAVYLMKLRSRALDALLIMSCFAGATLLIFRPAVATKFAHMVGIGRGVDLIFYLAIPGLALLLLLSFSRARENSAKFTELVRELALSNVRSNGEPGTK